ncbi:hypothetical protein KUA55_17670 [Enterococcus sp. ALS3]|uniref:DNA topoisomerase type IA zn finger domain-containing protein n=1 Tax=Enterococcus alishanensis TaxID=1303817 RepID=A0ABS6THV4_9ENTE|nr:hypothetical protein [Enterococcus alishanensis]
MIERQGHYGTFYGCSGFPHRCLGYLASRFHLRKPSPSWVIDFLFIIIGYPCSENGSCRNIIFL